MLKMSKICARRCCLPVCIVVMFACCDRSSVSLSQETADQKRQTERVAQADYSILFVGNSHTEAHNLTGTICDMIRFVQPDKTVYGDFIQVVFLEGALRETNYRKEIKLRPWKFVILQAQKISASGRHKYSRKDGLEMAKMAKERGASVLYYPEWGLYKVPGDGERQEKVYREMAAEAGVSLAPVARAWDLAIAEQPNLPLYETDGNHQSPLGAFLTACVIAGRITGVDANTFAEFPYPIGSAADRKLLAAAAEKSLQEFKQPQQPNEKKL
jgi:hypothetical protein